MIEYSPCKGCTNRHTACHGSCEAYKEWRDRYHAQQKKYDAQMYRWQTPWSTARERRTRDGLKFGAGSFKFGGSQ